MNDLTTSSIVGFIDSTEKQKGYVVYVGKDSSIGYVLHAVSMHHTEAHDTPNMSYGSMDNNSHTTMQGLLIDKIPSKVYVFDTQKELHKWLSE